MLVDKKKKELITRVISAFVGFPLVLIIFIFANNVVFSIAIALLTIICLYEYYNGFKINKKANPSSWIGYLASIILAIISLNEKIDIGMSVIWIILGSILILVTELLFSKGKKNIIDINVTIFGICYIAVMLFFFNLIYKMGKIYLWYPLIAAWGSDIFAFLVGRKIGKHKLTEVSPNKTIEGSVAGIVSAIIIAVIYTIVVNNVAALSINYFAIIIIVGILSVIGQIGDLAESSIKRYCDIKDFSNLIPGHGGMLDRFDSVIFIVPFAYILLMAFII